MRCVCVCGKNVITRFATICIYHSSIQKYSILREHNRITKNLKVSGVNTNIKKIIGNTYRILKYSIHYNPAQVFTILMRDGQTYIMLNVSKQRLAPF